MEAGVVECLKGWRCTVGGVEECGGRGGGVRGVEVCGSGGAVWEVWRCVGALEVCWNE